MTINVRMNAIDHLLSMYDSVSYTAPSQSKSNGNITEYHMDVKVGKKDDVLDLLKQNPTYYISDIRPKLNTIFVEIRLH